MLVNLNEIELKSRFFAKIICRERAHENLHDGTLYVLTKNSRDWNDTVFKVQDSIRKSNLKALWHVPYYIESMNDLLPLESDAGLMVYMLDGDYNLIMPLYTPDRSYKCYFIGRLDEFEHLESAFGFFTVDAQKICDECSFAAFVTSIETSPENAKQVWMKLIDYNSRNMMPNANQISFRGKYNASASEYAFLGKGFEKMINVPKMEYVDLVNSLKKLPDTVEAMMKKTDGDFYADKFEYVKICKHLSNVDKNELILELCKRIKDKNVLADAIDAVMNKGRSSRLKVQLLPKSSEGKIDGRRIHGDWCTYLVDENGNKQWLDFEPAAHVIYIMNLIHRINNPDKPSVVDVSLHETAFVDIYNKIYDGDAIEQYNGLVRNVSKRNGEGFERKRLKDCYKIIANCVNIQCSFFNESSSPYITNGDKPLTIDPTLIEISDKFMNDDRLKWLFNEK